MGRQKSDGRVVPKGRRKAIQSGESRGGEAATVEEQADQLALLVETAESPQGAPRKVVVGVPTMKALTVPKSSNGKSTSPPPMTMESIADEANLEAAFLKVAANRGAAGPDRVSVHRWNMNAVRGVTRALRNAYFSKRGLHDLASNWEVNHARIWNIGPEQQLLPLG